MEVTPAPRPVGSWLPGQTMAPGKVAAEAMQQLQEELQKGLQEGQLGEQPFKMFFLRPGLAMPEGWQGRLGIKLPQGFLPMPKNMSVTVTKLDDGPAQVVVKQGDKTWEVRENELDKLPEDVRKVVRGMLDGNTASLVLGGQGLTFGLDAHGAHAAGDGQAKPESADAAGHGKKEMEGALKKLDDVRRDMQENQKRLQRELERLRQQMEELKKQSR